MAETLNALLERANHLRLIKGFSCDNASIVVTHLQFADDIIIFCDADLVQVDNLKLIMKRFELLYGLKINYKKCEFVDNLKLILKRFEFVAKKFGCKIGKLPTKYLGLPLYLGLPNKYLWDPVLERIEQRLSNLKSRYLSLAGRLTLIKSMLASLPIYFFVMFKVS